MSALPSRPLRRIVLTTVSTVAGGLVLLALKPHATVGALSPAEAGSAPGPTATGSPSGGTGTGPSSGTSGSAGSSSGGASASPSPSSGSKSGGSSSTAKRTVDGDTIQTRYGPVQLRITLTGGRITAVNAVQLPQDNPRDSEISGFAVPQLTQETLSAQSARIDSVSGATYTSEGYVQSLQSALDKAGL
ncbi:FMN-binding protein [Actinacidiphila acidipaludis]|uniref:FMN-binding protein n=1 Tax=Actinacidiphila acidipaludis TaxID=2873382 RepID=A0ABS7Q886_9ACTN|nr:FMN-binding protein [Streptomyces acidipaludis]MBY8879370.1 FMN-binding protein [Streptomyces acidipaludis]